MSSEAAPQTDEDQVGLRLRHPTAQRPRNGMSDSAARGPTYLELSTKFDPYVKILAAQGNLGGTMFSAM